ncbi:hypothetical protein CDAR_168651 [Caerostris darwini]|uniref:Uncharacterized protein n=1 Tax=Caerostris darwini TaxID=1538125 RepID=A0AAV4T3Z9_9ARAC|nr:hypothetical protein CDAR_168651 [Caerostris darwini]
MKLGLLSLSDSSLDLCQIKDNSEKFPPASFTVVTRYFNILLQLSFSLFTSDNSACILTIDHKQAAYVTSRKENVRCVCPDTGDPSKKARLQHKSGGCWGTRPPPTSINQSRRSQPSVTRRYYLQRGGEVIKEDVEKCQVSLLGRPSLIFD